MAIHCLAEKYVKMFNIFWSDPYSQFRVHDRVLFFFFFKQATMNMTEGYIVHIPSEAVEKGINEYGEIGKDMNFIVLVLNKTYFLVSWPFYIWHISEIIIFFVAITCMFFARHKSKCFHRRYCHWVLRERFITLWFSLCAFNDFNWVTDKLRFWRHWGKCVGCVAWCDRSS